MSALRISRCQGSWASSSWAFKLAYEITGSALVRYRLEGNAVSTPLDTVKGLVSCGTDQFHYRFHEIIEMLIPNTTGRG